MKFKARTLCKSLARSERKNFSNQRKSFLNGKPACIRSEVARAVLNNSPRQNYSRKFFGKRQLQIRITFIIFETDIVARAIFLYQIAFQNQSLDFGRRYYRLEVGDFGNHCFDFRAVIFIRLKILADSIFQHNRLADVNNFSANIFHKVDARRFGQRL